MSNIKEQFIFAIIEREGAYSDNKNDSGGKTRWGVTERVARRHGYRGEMRHLPKATAFDILANRYWDGLSLDEVAALSIPIAAEVADSAVNCGARRAAEWLQRSLNVFNRNAALYSDIRVDGDIGPQTLQALRRYLQSRADDQGEWVLLRALNVLQGAHYLTLAERREKDEVFVFGWLKNRVVL
jgi:lysozyme family protein